MKIEASQWIKRFISLPNDEKSALGYSHEKSHTVSGYLMELSEDYTRGVYATRQEESPEGMQ